MRFLPWVREGRGFFIMQSNNPSLPLHISNRTPPRGGDLIMGKTRIILHSLY